jgi:pyruvate dehydrogenase E2 component (dihydrolipoamide acetyltransferase)
MAQETGKLIRWLKREGEAVMKGEPIMEIETDKVTVEIEASATGRLGGLRAHEGDVIPVGQTIAWILAPGESMPVDTGTARPAPASIQKAKVKASPLARKIAEEHSIDLARVKPDGGRVDKADVLAYLASPLPALSGEVGEGPEMRRIPASPKARRLAADRGVELVALHGSGPSGAVLVADVLAAVPEVAAMSATRPLK